MIKIGLLGFGTVGKASYEIIQEQKSEIKEYLGQDVEVVKVLVRDLEKYKDEKDYEIFTEDVNEIIEDPEIDVIMELAGGAGEVVEYWKKAIKAKKNIITANKDLLSRHYEEMMELAAENDVKIRYEAAVAGTIPVIAPMEKIAALNEVESVQGVLNGTCNFILSKMEDGGDYDSALKEAQDVGFAEADPSADVDGYDTMRKIRILATMAFKEPVKEEDIELEGISKIKPEDIEAAKAKDMRYKLVAEAKREDGEIKASVKLREVPINSILGGLDGGENAVIIQCSNAQEIVLRGLGAGGRPTGFSVVSDLLTMYKC